jgi:hypothetical protein
MSILAQLLHGRLTAVALLIAGAGCGPVVVRFAAARRAADTRWLARVIPGADLLRLSLV